LTKTESTTVAAIYSSPRKGGNSDTLMDSVVRGAEDAGGSVSRVYLRDMSFIPCQNCGYCSSKGTCRIDDDMRSLYDLYDNSDVIILASPIYFCSLCAQAKAMVDRCQPYWARKYLLDQEPPRRNRVGGFVCCCGFKDDRFLACTEQIVKTWYLVLNVQYAGHLFFPGLDKKEDAVRHPTAADDAVEYGRRLVEGPNDAG
jgi:multimeric flavodoxin WrbA